MGGNPFGGAGGNPFGGPGMADAMKKAQEAMQNPKTRAVIEKAQKNPKVMAAVQECMSNPMAMAKYMNDPEVGPIIKELQDAMM
jgi:suppressor of tumorigenicity protein 13